MASSFLIGLAAGDVRWACIDELSLCTRPIVGERRFQAYMAPFLDQQEARQALLEAGCTADSITAEIRPKRARRG